MSGIVRLIDGYNDLYADYEKLQERYKQLQEEYDNLFAKLVGKGCEYNQLLEVYNKLVLVGRALKIALMNELDLTPDEWIDIKAKYNIDDDEWWIKEYIRKS